MAGLLLALLRFALPPIHAPSISPKRMVHSSLRLRTSLSQYHTPDHGRHTLRPIKETAAADPKAPTDPFARPYRVESERRNQSERRPNEVPPTTPGNAVKR
ncbi:hypothetical protein LZ30DRAFT_684198 [Colletotrichum cereale]|nr:hypothetical protein LZ30DRAFT_684198 [Colletotrichum cereale]